MKILVIDDKEVNQASAHQTLTGHDLTVVGTYAEGHELLGWNSNSSFDVVLSDLLMPASDRSMGKEGLKFVGEEMPVGFALALMAALRGVKYVAVVTATNHHDHPLSAMLDEFVSYLPQGGDFLREGVRPRFLVNGSRLGFYHAGLYHGTGHPEAVPSFIAVDGTVCLDCNGKGCHWGCGTTGKQHGKNWKAFFVHLIS